MVQCKEILDLLEKLDAVFDANAFYHQVSIQGEGSLFEAQWIESHLELKDMIEKVKVMLDWQLIDTAPKTGIVYLCNIHDKSRVCGFFSDREQCFVNSDGEPYFATHWFPDMRDLFPTIPPIPDIYKVES